MTEMAFTTASSEKIFGNLRRWTYKKQVGAHSGPSCRTAVPSQNLTGLLGAPSLLLSSDPGRGTFHQGRA